MFFKRFRSTRRRASSLPSERNLLEKLELRTMLSVSLNSAGNTVINAEPGDRVIYCSSSTGSDSNSGLSVSSPVKSLARAEGMLRNHTGDQMLLKAGDTWYGDFIFWTLSGKSAQEPIVLGSYGSGARPTILTGSESGLLTGSVQAKEIDYVAIMGIHFDCSARDPALTSNPVRNDPVGINFITKSNDILVENCKIENYGVNINFQDLMGPQSNISIRKNVIVSAWSSDAHAQGVYISGVNGLTLQGNFLDHNGWNSKISGAGATWFNHDAYLSYNNANCVVTDNIFAEAAGYGLQARSGGIIKGNIFINDPVGMSFGIVTGAKTHAGGVTGVVADNVFIGGENIGPVDEGGGMIIGNVAPGAGAIISNNIFTQGIPTATAAIALTFGQFQPNASQSVGINDLKIVNNVIYDWTLGVVVAGGQVVGGHGINALNRLTVSGNEFENLSSYAFENHSTAYNATETLTGNSYYNASKWRQGDYVVKAVGNTSSSPLPFPSPNRSISTYASALNIGGGSSGLLAMAATQSEQAYNSSYDASSLVAYFESGFAKTAGSSVSAPPLTAPTVSTTTTPPTTPTPPITSTPPTTSKNPTASTPPVTSTPTTTSQNPTASTPPVTSTPITPSENPSASTPPTTSVTPPASTTPIIQTPAIAPTTTTASTTPISAAPVITPTLPPSGTPIATSGRSALTTVRALSFNKKKGSLKFDHFKGLGYANSGNWAEYNSIDFGAGVTNFTANVATPRRKTGSIQIRLDSPTGALIGTLKFTSTGSWKNYKPQSTAVTGATGVHNVYLVFAGGKGVVNIQSFQFS